jgi:Zn-dependent peptidase ImmA (M78 family)
VAEIPVNPDVLKWARSVRGLSVDAAAERLGIPASELRSYEDGAQRPTLSILREMSSKYRLNYAALFMPEPIDDAQTRPIKDFRLHGGSFGARAVSLETHVAIHEITGTLENLADLKAEAPNLFGKETIDTVEHGEQPEALASRQRTRFKVQASEQLEQWKSDAMARERWRAEIERRGVFVYFMPLGDECSGLSIKHEGLFAICVNDKTTNNGSRIFTLFHEYCHILRRQTGISDENFGNPVERFCNKFASAFLIPKSSLANIIGDPNEPRVFSISDVSRYAKRFKVSWTAMGLRLETLGYAERGLYDKIDAIVKAQSKEQPKRPIKVKIDPVQTQARRLGRRHTTITLAALDRGVINAADARGMLGVEPARFPALRAAVE